ncbi:hypothetical protein AKJ16_DCAP24885 [Drosera capensis]
MTLTVTLTTLRLRRRLAATGHSQL